MAQFPRYAPDYEIRIDGEPLPAAMRGAVSAVSYQDGMEGADRVELTLGNPGLRWLDHRLLNVDKGFKLSLGYAPDPLEEVFVGEITGVEPSFPNGGMPTIRVTAQDFLQRLSRGEKDRAFALTLPSIGHFPLPDVAVASLVSATNALIPFPDPVGGALSVLMTLATYYVAPQCAQDAVRKQQGESDFQLLSKIARENGWEMYIDHTLEPRGYVLRFQFLIQDYAPSLTLKWGSSLMDFTPRLTTVGDVFGVSARIWIESLKLELVVVVGWDFDRAALNFSIYPGLGNLAEVLGEEAASETISIKPVGITETPYKILTELLPRLNNRLTGTGSTVGDLRIKAGRVINLEGLGSEFSGLYRITSATHTLDSGGFKTGFQARKEVWFGSIPLPDGDSGVVQAQGITVV